MSHILLSTIAGILAATSIGAAKVTNLTAQKETNNQYEVVDLKDKVMRNYYDELDESKKEDLDFNNFSKGYYDSGKPIKDYVEDVNASAGTTRGAAAQWAVDDARTIISNSRKLNGTGSKPSRGDVLPKFDDVEVMDMEWDAQHEMCFSIDEGRNPDIPVYYDRELLATEQEKEDYVPWMANYLVPGDIVWDTISILPIDDINIFTHMALVVNTNKRGYTLDQYNHRHYFNFVETIEAFASGVRFGFLDDDRILQNGTVVLRAACGYYGQQPLRNNAVNFALKQYGKEYDVAGLVSTNYPVPDENRDRWYCTQLVLAAYYNNGNGFDITDYIAYPNPDNPVIDDNGNITTPICADMIARSRFTMGIDGFLEEYTDHFVQMSKYPRTNYELFNPSDKPYTVSYNKKLMDWFDAVKYYKTCCDSAVYIEPGQSVEVDLSKPWYEFLANTSVVTVRDGNTLYATVTHRFDDIWFPTYYKTTYDDFTITHNASSYTVQIKNRNSYAETYTYPSSLISYKDAMEWNFPSNVSKNNITIQPNSTVSVTINKNGNNMYAPFLLRDSSDENNAAIVRITPNRNGYNQVTTGHISTTPSSQGGSSSGGTTPTYPKVTMSSSIDFYFMFGTFNPVCHGSAEWYEVEGSVANSRMAECDWSTVQITSVSQWNNADPWNENIYFDETDGRFYINLSTFNRYPMGCVHIEYTYQATLFLESIALSGNYQRVFNFEDYFNSNNLVVTANYTCGYSRTISRSDSNLRIISTAYNQYQAGTYTIVVEYTESGIKKVTSYDVAVKNPALEYITLSGNYQTEYYFGDTINFDGLEVEAFFADGSSEMLSIDDVEINDYDFDPTDTGIYEIVVSYTFDGVTKSASYDVIVEERPYLVSISLSGNYKTEFNLGEVFRSTGLIVTAHYSDGTSMEVTDFSVDSSEYDAFTPDNYDVIVSYDDGYTGVSASYSVTVKPLQPSFNLLQSISLSGSYKKLFRIGQSFSYSGLIVTANYADGTSARVTNFNVDASDVNTSEEGIYTVRVSYTEGRVTKTASYSVFVIDKLHGKTNFDIVLDPKDPIIITRP